MNIYADVEQATSHKVMDISNKLKDFVYSRLRLLNHEIQNEHGCINVSMMQNIPEITFSDFSPGLTEKLKDCISTEDCTYIRKQLLSGI